MHPSTGKGFRFPPGRVQLAAMSKDHDPVFERGWLPPWGVEILRLFFVALFRTLTRTEVRGLDNLPPAGGFIISSNHLSRVDAPLVFLFLKNRPLTAFAADTYRSRLFFRAIIRSVDVIWVHRGAIGPSTVKYAIQALRNGRILGVAPEGTRSPTQALIEGKSGAAFLALAAGVPVVPMALDNTEKVLPSLARLHRQRVTLAIGKPIVFPPPADGRRPNPQLLEDCTTEIMCRIAALLPPERRGVYADHPRLKELLADSR
jgi:1-acyl-sn-glycerol-3-phosphate acyltransferase